MKQIRRRKEWLSRLPLSLHQFGEVSVPPQNRGISQLVGPRLGSVHFVDGPSLTRKGTKWICTEISSGRLSQRHSRSSYSTDESWPKYPPVVFRLSPHKCTFHRILTTV
ncbi:hypothetical protein B0H14DRAFT_3125891 [Mycena olivaceomarginata]|nr:hypothetical protein B0H14DRAFT_3125891 [Mycena olivaceomarginata]